MDIVKKQIMEEDLKEGDLVYYVDTINNKKLRVAEKVVISGIWDGKKVICTDKEMTTVRNKKWLSKEIPVLK